MSTRTDRQKMIRVTIRLTEDDYQKLKRMAASRGTSMSQVMRDGLRLLLEREWYT